MNESLKEGIVQRITRNLLDIQILRLVQMQPMWGYKIKKRVKAIHNITLRHGALYPLLNALKQQGFVTSQKQQQGGRTRKVYTITKRGQEYLEAYKNALKEQLQNSN